jgi:hypothetical protein
MPQQFLNDSQRDPPFQEMGRIGVSEGMDGGVFGEAAGAASISAPTPAPGGQGDEAVFPPCALVDPHQHPWGIDVRDLPRGPLPEAQPTGVDQPQTHRGCQVLTQDQEVPPCPRTPRGLHTTGCFWMCRGLTRSNTGRGRVRVSPE